MDHRKPKHQTTIRQPANSLWLLLFLCIAGPLAPGALAAAASAGCPQDVDVAASLAEADDCFRRADAALTAGDPEGALELGRRVVELCSVAEVMDTPTADALLWNSGILMRKCGALGESIDAQALVAHRRSRLDPGESQRVYDAHYSVAYYAEKTERFALAAVHFEAAYEALRELRADDDTQVLELRSRVGRMLFHDHQYEAARAWQAATLEDHLRNLDPLHPHLQSARNDLTFVLTELGEYDEALRLNADALEATEAAQPPDPFRRAWVIQQRGDLLRETGRRLEALESHRTALQEFEELGPPAIQWILLARQRVAVGLKELGHFEEGLRELQATVKLAKESGKYGASSQVALTNHMASAHRALGNIVRARELYESIVEIAREEFPPGHAHRFELMGGLANCSLALGDNDSALELFERELSAAIELYGPSHQNVQLIRNNLALALHELGRTEEALALQRLVVTSRQEALGPEHPSTTLSQLNLATLELHAGHFEAAYALANPAYAARCEQLAVHDPARLDAMGTLAAICAQTGRFDRALELQEERYRVCERTRPAHDFGVMKARQSWIQTLVHVGRSEEAQTLAGIQLHSIREAVRGAIGHSSARELEVFPRALREHVAELVQFSKGSLAPLQAEIFTTLETLRATSAVAGALATLDRNEDVLPSQGERETASALAAAVRGGAPPDRVSDLRADLESQRRARLARLAQLPDAAPLLADPTPAVLGRALGTGGVAVSYWVHRTPKAYAGEQRPSELWAHVVRGESELQRVSLGPLAAIAQAAADWRAAMGVAPGSAGLRGVTVEEDASESPLSEVEAGARLRALVWDPLEAWISGADRVILVLDGPLLSVPLDALPRDGGRLGDSLEFQQHLTLQELLWERPSVPEGSLLAVGGVAFSLPPQAPTPGETPELDAESNPRPGALLRESPWASGFAPLPATEAEVRSLADLAEELEIAETHLVQGPGATREAVEALAPKARFVHLATHGWFSLSALEAASSTPDELVSREALVTGVSPLVLCGVALAGANSPPGESGRAPGLVTGEEIASWDLTGCELAVLSACETSLGVVGDGVGAASLQKALHLAGARTVVASLWQVPDEPTRDLMVAFYRHLWSGTPKAEALWRAKTELRERKLPDGSPRYRERDWAAWVLTGDPR